MLEYVILTDEEDQCIGTMEKMQAHKLGLLHRAFSVFIFNSQGEILLQQRATNKYHSAGLWSNACCSHPRFMEEVSDAAKRRLYEEMGIICDTTFAFSFMYRVCFENGLIENEFDHVYFGITDDIPVPNEAEVNNWKYMNLSELKMDIEQSPDNYSEWLKICLPMLMDHFKDNFIQSSPKFYEQVSI